MPVGYKMLTYIALSVLEWIVSALIDGLGWISLLDFLLMIYTPLFLMLVCCPRISASNHAYLSPQIHFYLSLTHVSIYHTHVHSPRAHRAKAIVRCQRNVLPWFSVHCKPVGFPCSAHCRAHRVSNSGWSSGVDGRTGEVVRETRAQGKSGVQKLSEKKEEREREKEGEEVRERERER